MKPIATLTMNPTIDVSYDVARMRHTHKMRTDNERYAPGGGGINVARVLARLGEEVRCFYLSGGPTGLALDGLIGEHQLACTRIAIAGPTRIASAVLEQETGKEYRFTPKGPTIAESEWTACLAALDECDAGMIVLSGSLPPGVPDDFYATAIRRLRPRGADIVLDTSGAALAHAIEAGGLLMVKPSQGELQQYARRRLDTPEAIGRAAMGIVETGKARFVAVSMGHNGAVLAREGGPVMLPAVKIHAASAVGAGDSFVAGMIHALRTGRDELEAFRFAVAAGSAAVLRAGADLAHSHDIERLLRHVQTL